MPEHKDGTPEETRGFDADFAEHRRRQARSGLALSPAERLRWLEQTMEELRRIVGRARQGRPARGDR